MSTNATPSQESDGSIELDDRDVRALSEYMTVLGEGGDVFTVVGENGGGEYQVDSRKGRCTCPDHKHRNARCKHIRRVAFATGERAIPAWVDDDAVDEQLGEHVEGGPEVVAADGGVIAADTPTDDTDEGDLPSDPAAVTVADTGSGLLVFEVDSEHRAPLGREVQTAKELIGFAGVDDWAAIRDALRARGLGVGAVTNLPTFEIDEVPA